MKRSAVAIMFAILWSVASACAQEAALEPPVVGRPKDFSGAVGYYRIAASAEPTKVEVEKPITLIVRIAGNVAGKHGPRRAELNLFGADVDESFFAEPAPEKDRELAEQGVWEFGYRLRPKSIQVAEIPPLRFVYYSPRSRRFQTSYAEAISIQVTPAIFVEPKVENQRLVQAPAGFFEFRVDGLGEEQTVQSYLSWPYLTLLAGVPALLALAVFRWYRRQVPDMGKLKRRRASAASRAAVRVLEKSTDAADMTRTLGVYLRERFDFAAAEPTPAEVHAFLWRLGCRRRLCQEWQELLGTLNACQYQPAKSPEVPQLAERCVKTVMALEAEPIEQSAKSWHGRTALQVSSTLMLGLGISLSVRGADHEQATNPPSPAELKAAFMQATKDPREDAFASRVALRDLAMALERLPASASAYFNAGNCWFLAGDIPEAIFSYRRGLRLASHDPGLRSNLEHAQAGVNYPRGRGRPDADSWPPWLVRPTPGFLYGSTLVLFTLTGMGLTHGFWTRRFGWAVLGLMVSAGMAAAWLQLEHRIAVARNSPLVVIREETGLFTGNGVSYPRHADIPTLHAGMEARLLGRRGSWLHVELATGEIGWTPSSAALVEVLMPSRARSEAQ